MYELTLYLRLLTKDFLRILEAKVSPSKNRVLKCAILDGILDYKSYFEQLNLSMSGLVPNAKGGEHDVNHSWRFVTRADPCLVIDILL